MVVRDKLDPERDLVKVVVNALDARYGDSVIMSGLDFLLNVLRLAAVGVIHVIVVTVVAVIDSHGVGSGPLREDASGLGSGALQGSVAMARAACFEKHAIT